MDLCVIWLPSYTPPKVEKTPFLEVFCETLVQAILMRFGGRVVDGDSYPQSKWITSFGKHSNSHGILAFLRIWHSATYISTAHGQYQDNGKQSKLLHSATWSSILTYYWFGQLNTISSTWLFDKIIFLVVINFFCYLEAL